MQQNVMHFNCHVHIKHIFTLGKASVDSFLLPVCGGKSDQRLMMERCIIIGHILL